MNKRFICCNSVLYAAFFTLFMTSLPLVSYAQKPTASALDNPSASTTTQPSRNADTSSSVSAPKDSCVSYESDGKCAAHCTSLNSDGTCASVTISSFVMLQRRSLEYPSTAPEKSISTSQNYPLPNTKDDEAKANERTRLFNEQNGRTTSNSTEASKNKSDGDERARLFNQQNGRITVVNPDGSQSVKLVRRGGESDDDFRARVRTEMFNQQKKDSTIPYADERVIPPDRLNNSSTWTEEDGKKYTQGVKGRWEIRAFKATAWCADRMFMATGYVDACVVDENGKGAFKGTFLAIQNSSFRYPVYYGLSGVFNKMVGPGGKVTEDLHMYRAIDPAKRTNEPDTVVDVMVKYWVETP